MANSAGVPAALRPASSLVGRSASHAPSRMPSCAPSRAGRWLGGLLWSVLAVCHLSACAPPREPHIELPALPERTDGAVTGDDAGSSPPDGSVHCATKQDCDDGIACTTDSCRKPGYCVHYTDNRACDDGVFCNGFELCDFRTGCRAGPSQTCDDQDACSIDSCNEAQRACIHAPRDFDHDGEVDFHCAGGTDCDDFDPTRGLRKPELCADQIDNDCDDQVDEQPCGRPAHDACSDALDVSAGGSFEVQLQGASSDYAVSCNPQASPDVVFSFQLKRPKDVTLVANGMLSDGSAETAVLTLQKTCGDRGSELECKQGFPADLRRRALPAGRYFVVASASAARTMVLRATFAAPTNAPTNTRCTAPRDVSAGGTFTGDFVDLTDVTQSTCADKGQPDLFYAFTLGKTQDVEIAALSQEGGRLTFSVRSSCQSGAAELACESSDPAQTRLHQLPAGQYLLVLEGPVSSEVSFVLNVAFLPPTPPPAGDDCNNPLPLTAGTAVSVNLGDLRDSVDTSCQLGGHDAVFVLDLSNASDLSVQLDAGNSTAVLALQKTCGQSSSELRCEVGQPVKARVRNLAAGRYFVVVEAPAAPSVGLQVMTLPPTHPVAVKGNDTCAKAFDIDPQGGLWSGNTAALHDDYHADCGAGSVAADAVYRLKLTMPMHVAARIDAVFDSVLYRFTDSGGGSAVCDGAAPEACDDDSAGGTQAELSEMLDAGTYYYVVDGFKGAPGGSYLFDVTVTAK